MSEENEVSDNESDAVESEQEQTTDHIDMDEATQKRFNRIYGNMKQYERIVQTMGKENKALLERLEKLETSTQKRDIDAAVSELKRQKVQALDEGNTEAVVEIDEQLARVRSIEEQKPAPSNGSATEEIINSRDQELIYAWGNELDGNGNYKRPWAQAGHPHNAKAAAFGAAALEDPELVSRGTEAVLAEVDRLMGMEANKTGRRTSPVLANDGGVTPRSGGKTKLSDDEKIIAKAMGVSPEAYLKSKMEIQNAG